jgi:hypothetical protein
MCVLVLLFRASLSLKATSTGILSTAVFTLLALVGVLE